MTPKQHEVLFCIIEQTDDLPPTLQEIAAAMMITRPTVFGHVKILREDGYIEKGEKHRARTLRLTEKGKDLFDRCPLCGGIIL